jgi:hypothetical protein
VFLRARAETIALDFFHGVRELAADLERAGHCFT